MLRNRLYYKIKPLVPRKARLKMRGWFALRKRQQVAASWPILPGSEKPPTGWRGWPNGRKFALVLTHDVESHDGLLDCWRVAEMEASFGLRSSFNFIPEGDYRVSQALREDLVSEGFEIGVHDLRHDGRLYYDRETFGERAARINRYFTEWGAVGFRSGSMMHNLEWLHDLDGLYDASTFDTDPFEPQPDGVGTIFPFWVPRPDSESPRAQDSQRPGPKGYVELPYTLPQDSTLFLLMRERHPDIWFQKLDWVARHGGMALVNVHPDYMHFEGEGAGPGKYPAEFYCRFLDYVQKRHGGTFWAALPREIAAYCVRNDGAPAVMKTKGPGQKSAQSEAVLSN